MKQKEILLFGASGQIGRNLIRKLTTNNYKITAVTRNIHSAGYILKTQANPGYLELVEVKNFSSQKIEDLKDGTRLELWKLRRDRFDFQNNLISRFILTTVGRVVMNYTIIDSVSKT